MIIVPPGTIELCELCGEPLDADNCYGQEDFPLCREHHGKFEELLFFMIGQTPVKKEIQLKLFE